MVDDVRIGRLGLALLPLSLCVLPPLPARADALWCSADDPGRGTFYLSEIRQASHASRHARHRLRRRFARAIADETDSGIDGLQAECEAKSSAVLARALRDRQRLDRAASGETVRAVGLY